MAVVWFLLGVLALAGALVLLRIDGRRRAWQRKVRSIWGARRGLEFTRKVPQLAVQWRFGMIGRHSLTDGLNVVRGIPRVAQDEAQEHVIFDLEDAATIMAQQLTWESAISFELARTDPEGRTPNPALARACQGTFAAATVGEWTIYSDNAEAARRAADMRLVAFLDVIPDYVDTVWVESDWVLASFPKGMGWAQWDDVEALLYQFGQMMRVLPPAHAVEVYSA
ncbi:hypothetical protein IEU95_12770 [Hoyosella rhizosphaerae]|nr:hypothetical protein [Hoyosella rhizosphaerae]MBN4927709.1 hypothetical protein [Hoyosella rhizosphaerae]